MYIPTQIFGTHNSVPNWKHQKPKRPLSSLYTWTGKIRFVKWVTINSYELQNYNLWLESKKGQLEFLWESFVNKLYDGAMLMPDNSSFLMQKQITPSKLPYVNKKSALC